MFRSGTKCRQEAEAQALRSASIAGNARVPGNAREANQQVTFFSDGGDTVLHLPEYLNPQAEYILDWFHITMRITVLQQCARGLEKQWSAHVAHDPDEEGLERRLESVKHYLWHGNVSKALDQLRWLEEDLESWDYDEEGEHKRQPGSEGATRMLKYVRELDTYIVNNAGSIANYGERYHSGERISTGFVESTINQVVSKRMVKKQQMPGFPATPGNGRRKELTCSYKCELRCSTRIGKAHSVRGIHSFDLCRCQTRRFAQQPDTPDFLVLS